MSATAATRKLRTHGQSGNWRHKALMLAALPNSGVTRKDVAKAWPDPGKKSSYRFLAASDRAAEAERNRTVAAEPGTERHRVLSDFANDNNDGPKWLSAVPKPKELGDDGTLGAPLDAAVKRMLFADSSFEELDILFREQLLETIMAGRETRKIARDVMTVQNVDTRSGDVPVAADEIAAPEVAQGGAIRDENEQYATLSWDCSKYGIGSRVTDEAQDHAMVDLIERQIEWVGRAVERRVNIVGLTELIDNAGENFDTEGSDQGREAVNGAITEVEINDFESDTLVGHPRYFQALIDDETIFLGPRTGEDSAATDRMFSPLLGIDLNRASANNYSDDGDETWDFDDDGDIGAVVYQQDHAHIFMYAPNGQDIEVKEYDDPIRDLTGFNARVHVDADWSQERAGCTVEY